MKFTYISSSNIYVITDAPKCDVNIQILEGQAEIGEYKSMKNSKVMEKAPVYSYRRSRAEVSLLGESGSIFGLLPQTCPSGLDWDRNK